MKKSIIASLAALACAAVVGTFALAGAGKFGDVQVNADPVGYSVTFDESNTTVETVGSHYAIYTTTPRGAKVGVVGNPGGDGSFTFKDTHFSTLLLFDPVEGVLTGRAFEFSHITGFAISFEEGGLVAFAGGEMNEKIASEHEYTGLSFTPDDYPMFYAGGSVTFSSLTIWYSC